MKSPLGKLRKLGLNKGEAEEDWDHRISVHIDGLTQAAKDMKDMRACYDGLLSAAAATANSAYEFSESLMEMGNCLLEKTAMHDDGERGGALSLLGRVQHELQKLVDSYRSHIIMTITHPSESLLSELRKVEEMKLQCDEKRDMLEYMVAQFREKRKSRHGKGETFTSEQLQTVCEEYDEAARLCIFRVKSLKQGQCSSLLTQAARHHAAQLNFFRKGLHSLEAVEPHIRNVAEKQHIDYELSELNDGESIETNEDGKLSFDYSQNKKEVDNTTTSRNSMELDQLGAPSSQTSQTKNVEMQLNIGKTEGDVTLGEQRRAGSHSAPLYAEKSDPAERIRELRMSLQKFSRHVLPTPDDAKGSITSSTPLSSTTGSGGNKKNLWHSSPLDIEKQKKCIDDHIYGRSFSKSQVSAEDTSNKKHFLPLPPAVPQFDTRGGFDSQKVKRQAFSGPIVSKPSVNKQPLVPTSGPITSSEVSGSHSFVSGPQPPSSLNVSQNAPPPLVSSPKISELHELPRPPDSFGSKPMHSAGVLGHSAPLMSRNREVSPTNKNPFVSSKEGSPLPLPQLTVSRSFSIPSSSQRAIALHSGKLLECSQIVQKTEKVPSPPLTPISLLNMKSPNSGQIRGNVNNFSS